MVRWWEVGTGGGWEGGDRWGWEGRVRANI